MHNWSFNRVDVDDLGKTRNANMDHPVLTLKRVFCWHTRFDDEIELVMGKNLRDYKHYLWENIGE